MTAWHPEETYKSLIQISIGALRFGAIVNGGAAIALLALFGDLFKLNTMIPDLRCPMLCFIAGIVLSGLAHICSYLTQLQLYSESAFEIEPKGIRNHQLFLWAAILLVLGSIVFFAVGAYKATSIITLAPSAT